MATNRMLTTNGTRKNNFNYIITMKIQTVYSPIGIVLVIKQYIGHGKCNKVALGKNKIPTIFTVTMRYLTMEKQE